jgi:hypothetical protein
MTTKGLKWRHLFWLSLFLYLLIAAISADAPYSLSHALAFKIWDSLFSGFSGATKWQTEKAHELDKWGKEKWKPITPQASNCVSKISDTGIIDTAKLTKLRLSKPKTESEAITILGLPYCQSVSGNKVYILPGKEILEISKPFKMQIIKPKSKK